MIRNLVEIVISLKCSTIALTNDSKRTTHYRGALDPAVIKAETELYLAVKADMPALELVAAVPLLFKVGSPDYVESSITSALPGIPLTYMAQVPSAIPVRPNTYYFSLKAKHSLYEAMLKAKVVTIYVPGGIESLQLELFALEM